MFYGILKEREDEKKKTSWFSQLVLPKLALCLRSPSPGSQGSSQGGGQVLEQQHSGDAMLEEASSRFAEKTGRTDAHSTRKGAAFRSQIWSAP